MLRLIAFDFGTTTSKALIAKAELLRNAVTGRTEIRAISDIRRTEPVFTPFAGENIDEKLLEDLVSGWLEQAETSSDLTTTGGVIITGLAAKKLNARAIAAAVRAKLGDAVIAVADDPGKESWLAFMGSSASLSALHPKRQFINMDIGGGTTNLALGQNQTVLATGSLWVGARHFLFTPGSYRLVGVSECARQLCQKLGVKISIGDELPRESIDTLIDFYLKVLLQTLQGAKVPQARLVEQLPFRFRSTSHLAPLVTFSGGVGELVYQIAAGEKFPPTPFGDLGVDLAQAIVNCPALAASLEQFVPANRGRATVSGLAFHGIEASGATVFLPNRAILPLRDLPLVGRISHKTKPVDIQNLIAQARGFANGSCLRADCQSESLDDLRALANKLNAALKTSSKCSKNDYANKPPLIIFLAQNLGKTFGHYVTEWGQLQANLWANLVVIDEIDMSIVDEKAYFASVFPSDQKSGNLLVSFYGDLKLPSSRSC